MTLPKGRLTRRALLSVAASGAASLLAACQQPTSPVRSSGARSTPLPTPEPRPTQPPAQAAPAVAEGTVGRATAGAQAAPAGPPKPGGSVVWAAEADPVTLDPYAGAGPASLGVWADLAYQSLVMFDEHLKLVPCLAEAWVNTSPTTWTFKLRQGVRFHDGSKFQAEDVRAWHDRLTASSRTGTAPAWPAQIARVEPRGAYEIDVTLREPYSPLLSALAGLDGSALLPRGWLQRAGTAAQTQAVGSGPFKIAEYVPGSHVRYVKHAEYWERGLPYLNEVTLRIVPDEAARVRALLAGDVTYARVGPASARSLRNEKRLAVLTSPGPSQRATVFNTRRAPFDDARVRQAISLMVDRPAAIASLTGGEGRLSGPIPAGIGAFGWPPDALPYRRDPGGARQLLEEAGHPDGFEATIKAPSDQPGLLALASLVAEQVRPLGISLTVEQVDRAALLRSIEAHDFDLAAVGTDFHPDPDGYLTVAPGSRSVVQASGWENARYTELVEAARSVLDPGQRKLWYDEAVTLLLTEVPAIWWVTEDTVEVVHTSIKGYLPSFTGRRAGLKKTWLDR